MEINRIEMNGYTLYLIPNNKFKTFTVGTYFIRPLEENGLVESSILSNMFMKYNQDFPSERILSQYLESLYGMSLYSNLSRNGLTNTISVVINSINDQYLENTNDQNVNKLNLLDKAVELLYTTITKPYFNEDLFKIEKELLLEDIERVYNNKQQYATLRFIDIMYSSERCKYSVLSSYERAKQVNLDDVKNEYKSLMDAKKVFFIIGDFTLEEVEKSFSNVKFGINHDLNLDFFDYETKKIEQITEVIEEQNNKQSLVFMGYRSEIRENDPRYFGMYVLNNMLGGFFHSTLFQEIREKNSLAYSVSSEYNSKKGTFVITAGISKDKFDRFKEIVNKIISDYQNGLIDDNTFNLTKKLLINAQYKIADQTTYGLRNILQELSGLNAYTLEEKVEIINNVTKKDVVLAAKTLVLDTIYLLKGNL